MSISRLNPEAGQQVPPLDWREIAHRAGGKQTRGRRASSWTGLAKQIGTHTRDSTECSKPFSFLRTEQPLPFEDLIAPAVRLARERVWSVARENEYVLLSETAWDALQRALLSRLLRVAHDPLFLEWAVHRAVRPDASVPAQTRGHRDGASQYRAFVARHGAEGLATLFTRYPVVARLWVSITEDWISSTASLLHRLRADWPKLRRELLPRLPEEPVAGTVRGIKAGMSDPHESGATVLALTLRPGGSLIYKPRALGPDRAYFRLLAALNREAHGLPQLRVAKVLCVEDRARAARQRASSAYGWMEFVAAARATDTGAVRRYFRRAGGMVCLHYCLRTVDGHEENWVAAGEQPVCVDLETCAYPAFARSRQGDAGSLLRTGTLPFPGYDIAPFGTTQCRRTLLTQRRWRAINRDAMWVEEARVRYRASVLPSCVRMRDGAAINASRYRAEMVRGFELMAAELGGNPAAQTAFRRCVAELDRGHAALRWLPRPTAFYNSLLARLSRVDCLQDGAVFGSVLRDGLASEHSEKIRSRERHALERFTIPRFSQGPAGQRWNAALCAALDHPEFAEDLRRQAHVLARALTPDRRLCRP